MDGGDIIRHQMKQAVVEDEFGAIVDFLDEGLYFLTIAIPLI